MAYLIIVHQDSDNEEILLNRDHIIHARRVDPSTTQVVLRDDQSLLIKETLSALRSKTF